MITPDLREKAMQEMENTLRPKAEALLEQCRSDLPKRVRRVKRVHQIGLPATVILEAVKSVNPDLIIMGARGLGPIKELAMGSVSHRVLLHAPCSILIVKNPLPTLEHVLMPIESKSDAEYLLRYLFSLPFETKPRLSVMSVWPQPQLPWPETLSQSRLLEERALAHPVTWPKK